MPTEYHVNGGPRLLLVTDERFWRKAEGSHARIGSLCHHLARRDGRLVILFVGTLTLQDRQVLETLDPRLEIVAPDLGGYHNSLGFRIAQGISHALPVRIRQALRTGLRSLMNAATTAGGTDNDDRRPAGDRRLADFVQPQFSDLFRQVLTAYRPAVVIIEYVRLAYLVEAASDRRLAGILKVIDTHDIQSDRQQAFNDHGQPHYLAITREEEIRALRRFDIVLAIQRRDALILGQMVPDRPILTVGHAYPVERLPPVGGERCVLGFLGGPGRANLYAIDFFLEAVWPPLRQRFGQHLMLSIWGTICERLAGRALPAGVTLMGPVAEVREVYEQTRVAVNPVAFGGGLKIKNVEALCYGIPLVTTPVGAEGLEDGAGTAFLVCRGAHEMETAITQLVQSAQRRDALSRGAIEYAAAHFSEAAAYATLTPMLGLNQAGTRCRRPGPSRCD